MAAFKYKNKREYADYYCMEYLTQFEDSLRKLNLDGVVAIPIHKRKKRSRGYNQSHLLAKGIGKGLGIPVYDKLLVRVVNTLPQKQLNNIERLKNLERAFQIGTIQKLPKRILLMDDIYTTGSTIEACTTVLHKAGVTDIYYGSICIGKGI